MSSLLRSGGTNYIGVRDVPAAAAWYIEKLGLRKMPIEMDDCEGCVTLGFGKEEYAVTLGPIVAADSQQTDELTHSLFTTKVSKAREWLLSRGVQVGELQQDRQGTHYFEMRDLENNVIEITEEP